MSRITRLLLISLLLSTAAWMLAGCGGTFLLSKDDEIKIGADAAAEFDKKHRVDRTSDQARRIATIGRRVADATDPPHYPYSFTLVREDTVNAFAYPGGKIYIYEGLINEINNDTDGIAWVLGHEITHIQQRHSAKAIERAIGAGVLIDLTLGRNTGGQIAGVVAGLALQDYGRDHEFTADRLGIKWAGRAGYDPTAAIMVLQTFQRLQGKDPSDFEIMFMTHPGNNDRINHVKKVLDELGYSGKYYTAQTK
ncbi:MAG: M48 family metalloprotease [Armatimonadetes bacterium]|nr:M48 family metalloprotease [Armatimonadota bacterium]